MDPFEFFRKRHSENLYFTSVSRELRKRFIKILCIGVDAVENFNQMEAVLCAFKGLSCFCGEKPYS